LIKSKKKNAACARRLGTARSAGNRENAATGKKGSERHHGFATVKEEPEKSGRTYLPQRILMARDKIKEQKIKTRA
jgi:hypothetical protein